MAITKSKSKNREEFGDFQTPFPLAHAVLSCISRRWDISPSCLVEPTCGQGTFVSAAMKIFPTAKTMVVAEINGDYLREVALKLSAAVSETEVRLIEGDFFKINWGEALPERSDFYLIFGNPPWVTTAALGALGSGNQPAKVNVVGSGIEAVTGKSNFDVSEWMIYQYAEWLATRSGAIAVLCKTSVARKVIVNLSQKHERPFTAEVFRVDALEYFGASVDACLLGIRFDEHGSYSSYHLYDTLESTSATESFVVEGDHLVNRALSDVYSRFGGPETYYIWRSGVKHDCSKVMELTAQPDSSFRNGLHEDVSIEPDYLYPMLKSSDIANGRLQKNRFMLVPQARVGEVTSVIRSLAPYTWAYLADHMSYFEKRASIIYKGKPDFSIFGVGEYSFAPWKVAISALYKRLEFTIVGPRDGKPVFFDDTVNFLSVNSQEEATFIRELLCCQEAQSFYQSMIHWSDKRPITISCLRRLSLSSVAEHLGRGDEYLRFSGKNSKIGQSSFAF